MATGRLPSQNGVVTNGDLNANSNSSTATKKSRENERRRRRREQKNNNKVFAQPESNVGEVSDAAATADDETKENNDSQQVVEQVKVEYVPEKAELGEGLDEEFRKIFEKLRFAKQLV